MTALLPGLPAPPGTGKETVAPRPPIRDLPPAGPNFETKTAAKISPKAIQSRIASFSLRTNTAKSENTTSVIASCITFNWAAENGPPWSRCPSRFAGT